MRDKNNRAFREQKFLILSLMRAGQSWNAAVLRGLGGRYDGGFVDDNRDGDDGDDGDDGGSILKGAE